MANKIYKKLPGILQTNTVKNFFESTVEQLYSKANLEPISGFIGKKTSKDKLVDGVWIYEEDINKQFYSLTPAVNTTNATTNTSEDFMFYDELVATLKNYNVEMSDENKIFSTHYQSFLPPIEYNKFINYQEYFWTPHGSIKTLTASISADSNRTAGSYTIDSSKYTTSGNGFNAEFSVVISSNGSGTVSLNKEGLYFNTNDTVTITDTNLGGGGGADITLTITDVIKSPTAISVSGTATNPIDVDKDIVGKSTYTPVGGKTFRNGMKIAFAGSYVIDNSKYSGNEYIVEGVGDEIVLVPVIQNYSNGYNNPQTSKDYVLLGRGAVNNNVWSRVNFWYHKENFTDAGDDVPAKVHQADRPILEFDKDLELYNHGITSKGNVDVSSELLYSEINGLDASNVTIDSVTVQTGTKIIFPNESSDISKNIYVATVANASLSNAISLSVDSTFIENNTVFVSSGNQEIGKEYYYNDGLVQAQVKSKLNQAPLFNLYDDMHRELGNKLIFPSSTFTGNKIFGLEVGTGTKDPVYGIPLVYRAFKSASEISFINFIDSTTYSHIALGGSDFTDISGNYKYKLCKTKPRYFNTFKDVTAKSTQRIETIHEITRTKLDEFSTKFDIGCIPDQLNRNTVDGDDSLDIIVKKNGTSFTNYSYIDNSITIERKYLAVGDIFEVSAFSSSGLIISTNNKSKHTLPLAWSNNPLNKSITKISEPEYLPHFKKYMEDQIGFTGDSLNVNNFSDLEKKADCATDIVQTNEDLILGAFLLDDKPHNLVEALRFNANEYGRYKKRFLKELENYFNIVDFSEVSNEEILEKVLRNLISFSVGRNVFGDTYIMPFGDNYEKESKIIDDITLSSHTLTSTADLDKIENSLLVYYTRKGVKTLMTIGDEYTLTYSPLTIKFNNYTPELLDELEFKIYNKDRDSVECPPTPSTMGLYPLYSPCKESDTSFTEAQDVIKGHDGSRLPVFNDLRDDIVLEFEKRIYNSAKAEFRTANSLPELNILETRPGAFRLNHLNGPKNLSISEFNDLLQTNFENWVIENKVDPIVNEFYDPTDEFTWNYRGTTDQPGYWRGWYEYYYDTVRPHTHPWEMLGFVDKPTWWDSQYITTEYSNYGSNNTPMWSDLDKGIIRQGDRENITNDNYLGNYLSSGQNSGDTNLYRRRLAGRRTGLIDLLPVDSDANLKSPYDIGDTGTTTRRVRYSESIVDVSQGYKTRSFLKKDGINISYNASKIYIRSISKPNYSRTLVRELPLNTINFLTQTYSLPNTIDLTTVAEGNGTDNSFSDGAIGILVNGLPLMSVLSSNTWGTTGWVYNKEYEDNKLRSSNDIAITNEKGVTTTTVITSEMSNTSVWGDSSTHSGIVGWAFDGLPIYGPYGYTDPLDSSSAITNIKSGFVLNPDTRPNGPGGAPTGVFVQDYRYDTNSNVSLGYASKYNHRVGYTPDSPSSPIRYYVVTIDDTGTPMFPYAIGGVAGSTSELPESSMTLNTYVGKTYATLNNITQNKIGDVLLPDGTTDAQTSTPNIRQTNTTEIENFWRLGDGAPVENAWKYSEKYPFAVVEALLLHRPGQFATVFSDPTKLLELSYNLYEGGFNRNYLSKLTRKSWDFTSSTDFEIHGDIDDDGNIVTNIGYTQFINSWLRFQGLDIKTFFADKVRTLNTKLGYRFSGYVDKDTMTMSMDQYSTTGSSTNLIIPQENITLSVHNSPYKSRNIYQGVIIQKASTGYIVKGYDKNLGHFKILESDVTGRSEKIQVGGEPHPYVDWQASTSYNKGTIVNYNDVYYEAKEYVPGANTFSGLLYKKLNRLPQINSKSGAVYLDTTGTIKKVDYETVYTSEQDVFDFLVSLGRYQKDLGYTFGEYDIDINDTRDWIYSAKQFLFWLQDNWQVGNTLELSPMANKITFETTKGFVAKIKRSEYNMFNIMDKDGKSINPKECSINRQDLKLEIIPPKGKEIYAVCLFVREIEHAMVLDNVTDFADTLFDPLLNQQQSRIRLKGNRTANWDGRFISEGFLIQNDSLKPNLDNLAESMGRYHELGFIPVEKQVYETARSLFGYQEKKYLSELEIDDDQQFEFYKGFIQNKGTKTSLSRIGRSSAIIQGDMDIYDEWALKVGSFGDLENDQSVELALVKSDFVQDPQLFTLAFPEDTTGVIDRIDVLEADHKYFELPVINITGDGANATATATLNTNGLISSIAVNNQGTGYTDTVGLTVTTAEINVGTITSTIANIEAKSTSAVTDFNVTLNDKTYQTARVVSVSQNDANGIVTVTGNLEGISNTHSVSFVGDDQGNLTSTYEISNVTSTTFTIDVKPGTDPVVPNAIVQANAGNINYISHSTSTSANTIVISNAHGLSNGDDVYISNTNPITKTVESIFFNISNVTTNTFEIVTNRLFSNVSGLYGKKNNNITNLTGLSNLIITDNFGASATIDVSSVNDVANIVTAINNESTINANITAHLIQNDVTSANTFTQYRSLKITGNDFNLADSDSNVTLGKLKLQAKRYQPRQRYAFNMAVANTPVVAGSFKIGNTYKIVSAGTTDFTLIGASDNNVGTFFVATVGSQTGTGTAKNYGKVVVKVDNTDVTASNYDFDPGDRWQESLGSVGTGNVTYTLGTGIIEGATSFASDNITEYNGEYPYVDVYVNGTQLYNSGIEANNLYTVNNATSITINAALFEGGTIPAEANVTIIERPTIDLTDAYQGDLPGSTLSIKATTDDDIAVHVKSIRLYEITPDAKDDEVILIDIDDTTRFLKKPSGVRESNIWPNTANVNFQGLQDSKYNPLPNSGYVKEGTVNFSAFDVGSIPDLFGDNIRFKPTGNDFIHVAKSENLDWNVYKLKQANQGNVNFVEQDDATQTAHLYTERSLFNYVDSNQLLEDDLSRYLDYTLVIKKADLSDEFVVWANEDIVRRKTVQISNFGRANMITANIGNIGPTRVISISDIQPAISAYTNADANVIGSDTIQISGSQGNLANGDTVEFFVNSTTDRSFTVSNANVQYVTLTDTANLSTSSNVLTFTANDDYDFYNTVTVGGISINLESMDMAIANADTDPHSDHNQDEYDSVSNSLINEDNIKIPTDQLTSTPQSVILTRIHTSKLKLIMNDIGQGGDTVSANGNLAIGQLYVVKDSGNTNFTALGASSNAVGTVFTASGVGSGTGSANTVVVAANNIVRLTTLDSNSPYSNASFTVTEVDSANSSIVIDIDILNRDLDDEFDNQYLTNGEIGINGFVFEEQYPLHAQRHTIDNVSLTGFTVEQANVTGNIDAGNLSYGIFGKTEITATDHDLTSGELIKLDASAYSGFYYVESASTDTFKIDAPYNASIPASGNIIPEGITINTTEDHGINVAYVGKRIAVHLATPRYYNQVYRVGDITSNTIIIDNSFGFYPYVSEQYRDWSAGLTISKDERIRYNNVFYNAKQDFTSNVSFSVDLEAERFGPGMPTTITTLDHGAITLNNSLININNINSPESIKEEFNRQMDLRRGIIDEDGLTIPMLNNIECSERVYAGIPSSEIQGASPYAPVAPNMEGLLQKGVMQFGTVDDLKYGFPGESIDDVYGGDQKLFNHNFAGHSITNPTTRTNSTVGQVRDNTTIPLYDIASSGKTVRRTDYVGSPILDPVKAFASLDVKLCDICAPAPPPVSSTVTNRNGKKYITKNYGGTITVSASGNGKGKRGWQNSYSGYYITTGTKRGQVTQSGGSKHMPADALLGAITWADNGSRNTFSLSCTFSEAGTFYVHAYYSAKNTGGSASVSISGAAGSRSVSPKHLGKTDSNYSGAGSIIEFTVTAGQTVTINGVAQWGSNHWNSVGFHLSTRAGSLSTTATIEDPSTATPVTPPTNSSTNSNTQIEFIEQSTTAWAQGNAGKNDEWLFNPGASGTIEVLFDMYSGADGIEIYQGDQVTQGTLISSSQTQNLSVLTEAEKNEILTNAQKPGSKRNTGQSGVIRNYIQSSISAPNNTGVKYGGAIRFNYNKANGDFIKIKVYKSSSVYRFLLKYPKVGPNISNPGQNPTTTGPCDTASNGNTTVSGGSLPQTPINTPVGGGGTTGGGTTGGGTTGGGTTGGGTTGGGGGCFVADTQITMKDGTFKAIQDVKVGDIITSMKNDGELAPGEVLEITTPRVDTIAVYKIDNIVLECTPDHPIYIDNKGWCSLDPVATKQNHNLDVSVISVNDRVVLEDSTTNTIQHIEIKQQETQTYNLSSVKDYHTYFANGVLVHNKMNRGVGSGGGGGYKQKQAIIQAYGPVIPYVAPIPKMPIYPKPQITPFISPAILSIAPISKGFNVASTFGIGGGLKGMKSLLKHDRHAPDNFFQSNFGDVGLPSLAGHRFIPNILRKTVKVTKPSNIGRYIPLESGQYVNTTMQKVTGGKKVPLATPLIDAVPLRPSPLRAIDVKEYNYNFISELSNPFFSKTDNQIMFAAQKIGGDLILPDGSSIRNVLGDAGGISSDVIEFRYPGNELVDFTNRNVTDTYEYLPRDTQLPDDTTPPDTDNIEFNRNGGFEIQPLLRSPDGNYIVGGPPVNCHFHRPTPGISIPLANMTGIKPGDELLINNRKYTFPGSDPKVVVNTLRCGPKGSGIEVKDTKVNGQDAIRISSCSNAPIIIRDGCAGGVYKEVLDFHVVRGFEQSVVDTSNTVVLPGFSQGNVTLGATTVEYTTYGPTGNITGTLNNIAGDGIGSVLSSSSSSRSTGGSGYIVGDRLRLVGGTPIADPYGSITEICLNSPGSGYSDTANIVVYIGDGNTPGSGAKAGSVILDDTGGIKNILMVSGGEGYDITNPPTVRIIDLNNNGGGTVLPATAHAKVAGGDSVPPRVAKFVVTSIDAVGTITSLQIIDRGIYKIFPSDLTMGIPLEYDYVNLGDETGTDADGNFYQGTGLGQFDPLSNGKRLGTPGGYDPINDTLGGGSGARVFLTAREIPDCSEKGNAMSQLGLPERVTEINIPEDIAACFNNNLAGPGYDKDLYLETEPVNDCITALKIKHPGFDGVRLNENVPGFLDRLGLPKGDYNQDMLCMTSTIITKSYEQDRDKTGVVGTDIVDIDGYGTSGFATTESTTLEIYCIDNLITDPNSLFGVAGNTGGADSANAVGLNYTTDLYQYQLETLQGQPVNTLKLQQNCDIYYLESHRFANVSQLHSHFPKDPVNGVYVGSEVSTIAGSFVTGSTYTIVSPGSTDFTLIGAAGNTAGTVFTATGVGSGSGTAKITLNVEDYDKAWIDNYNTAIGWAYVESNDIKYSNSPLVDSKFVNNTIIYDAETGEKDWDIYEYDPFKGIIPGFIEKEIEFIGQSDPVVYTQARTRFGSKDVGKVWWDTSTIRYKWYEQGTNRERWLNWGKTFPGSSITLFEWVESDTLPQTYIGSGTPKNLVEYITELSKDEITGLNTIKYYFWVQNKLELEPTVVEDLGRTLNTFELARLLADPIGQGLPLISFISDTSFVLSNASSIIKEDEQNLQINLSKNLNPIGQKHNAWKLLREGDNNSIIPLDLGNKLIDSLCGVDASGKSVPDPLLSEVEKYGVAFRPRQTMFSDVKEARRELAYTLNELLADVKLTSNFTNWDIDLPTTRTYIETVNWFETIRTDASNNKKIRYDSTYKPILNVGSVSELTAVTSSIKDGAIIQVKPNVTSRYELWKYVASTNTFTQIAIENETIKLKDTIFTDESNALMQTELRALLVALRDNVFTSNLQWNKLFFALLKYSAVEQEQLSWAFKTSYVYIEKQEEDLVAVDGFKVDNFDKVLQYLDDAKPYTSKIREYKDGKSPAKELIQYTQISDFDKPPYPDSVSGNIRILDDFLQSDSNIIQTNNNYVKYFGFSSNADVNTPIRKLKSTIVFDRTHTVLTDFVPLSNINADYTLVDNNTSIATNIVTLMGYGNTHNSNTFISSNEHYRYADRVFKFDTEVQEQFTKDIFNYYPEWKEDTEYDYSKFKYISRDSKLYEITGGLSTADILGTTPTQSIKTIYVTGTSFDNTSLQEISSPYGNIYSNVTELQSIIDGSGLNSTLALVTDKVGGNFRGTTIDAKLFKTQRGYGSEPVGLLAYDKKISIDNYEGTFTGTSTLTKDNIAYDGFDGVTFQRVGYGDLVPEEMALFDPYETLILNIFTDADSKYANGVIIANSTTYQPPFTHTGNTVNRFGTNVILDGNDVDSTGNIHFANGSVQPNKTVFTGTVVTPSTNPSTVEYQITMDLFGKTEYMRKLQDGSTNTSLTANLLIADSTISVANANVCSNPTALIKGVVWVESERIEYTTRNLDNNTLSGLIRGTNGTTIQDWYSSNNVNIWNGNSEQIFDEFIDNSVESNVWLDTGATSLTDKGNVSTNTSVMNFIHNLK